MFSMNLRGLSSVVSPMAKAMDVKGSTKTQTSRVDSSTARVVLAALLCVVLALDISQLAFALAGAVIFAILQSYRPQRKQPKVMHQKPRQGDYSKGQSAQQQKHCERFKVPGACMHKGRQDKSNPGAAKQNNSAPVLPPTFSSTGWDAEVNELLDQISPTASGEKAVKTLATLVERVIRPILPEVEVVGFASGNFAQGKAFGVAVPEVDVIASVSPAALARCLQQRSGPGADWRDATVESNPWKLQKWAIRACTDRLVATGDFKFRRSAFQSNEPKVTLLASMSTGIGGEAIAIDFSVNAVTPLYNAALLTECGHMEYRAKALILLVRRWAKDRGICHAPKGHMTPYAWSLLAIYFLQVNACKEGSLLPPLKDFAASSGLMAKSQAPKRTCKSAAPASHASVPLATTPVEIIGSDNKMSVGTLFKEFVHFYHSLFDWRGEAVSVRLGARAAPDLALPLHIIVQEDGCSSEVGPSVEDPFDVSRNLCGHMTAESLKRLHEELARADALCVQQASLTKLLDPWCPPEFEARDLKSKCDDDQASTRAPSESACSSPPRSPPPTPPKVSPRAMPVSPMAQGSTPAKSSRGRASTPPWRRR
mmetsp:Transcript_113588/g.200529  ORF Transcript_113588/g.200529 Transcript_113588/m.200529 type:complete len:596 (-) Transcript_113588:95-1882(-)